MVRQKRFQYWGSISGIPTIMWSEWIEWHGDEPKIQQKGFKGKHLLNEYRTV